MHGGIKGPYGITTIIPRKTQKLEELFSEFDETKMKNSNFWATCRDYRYHRGGEAVKIITHCGGYLTNKLLIVDLAMDSIETINKAEIKENRLSPKLFGSPH